jgi:menaquinone-dependent protoporphyrinogen oxidase
VSVLIVYASRYGCTERCAREIGSRVPGPTYLDLRGRKPDAAALLEASSAVAIGGPIYAGRILKAVPRFCEAHRTALLGRRVVLFITCLERGVRAREELGGAFPEWLIAHAYSRRILGGEARPAAMRHVDRFLFRKVAGETGDVLRLDNHEIEKVARELAVQ